MRRKRHIGEDKRQFSCCWWRRHFFSLYLSNEAGGRPCGLIWHLVIRLIMFPAGWSPSNLSHRHTTPCDCIRTILLFLFSVPFFSNLWLYGSLRTERQGCRKGKTHTAVEKHKRKMNVRMVCFVNIMTRVFKSKMYDAASTHAQFARCPMLSVIFLCSKTDAKNFSVSTRLFVKWFSCASDARSCETHFFGKISPVLPPFPPKKPRIWLFNCNLIGWWWEITDCVTALQGKTYCGRASDGQAPEAEAVFHSHLDSYADNTLPRQRECVAQPYN